MLILSLLMAQEIGIDPTDAILRKLDANAIKYPVEKARGSAKKYTDL